MKLRFLLLFALLLTGRLTAGELLPAPRYRIFSEGRFILTSHTVITAEKSLDSLAGYLHEYLPAATVCHRLSADGGISLITDPALEEEEYRLIVHPSRIEITGGGYGGVFNGIQTLLQLLPAEVYAGRLRLPTEIPCQIIEDGPRFSYRGQHLDVARTFIGMDRVKRYIDAVSHHKINKLHFHLTDDEGWRIEIRSHPELAETGGFRGGDSPVRAIYGKWGEKYGGYYTQEELKELIAYAAVRNVEIIPEIDLPGHSRTVARIHPEILCRYTPDLTASNGYDERSAWCVAREENYTLLEDILREVCTLFPSPYVHIGGDEVEMTQWKRCPDCQALMRREKMSSPAQLQRHFMTRLFAILAKYGKRPAVWNEAIRGGRLPAESRVHGWENLKACLESTSQGYSTVVMPGEYFYFDMRQSPHEEGHTWAAVIDARRVYSFDFEKAGFTAERMQHVEGLEGAFWSEIHLSQNPESPDYLDYMLFPRICALSELCWNGSGRGSWEEFYRTLAEHHYDRLTNMGLCFRLFPPEVVYGDGVLTAATDDGSTLYYRTESDSGIYLYSGPIRTAHPENYRFESRRGTGHSPLTATAHFYRTITPEVRITSSMPVRENAPFSRAEQYKAFARTTRTCRPGDWVQFTFAQPVRFRELYMQTGYLQLPRLIFESGYAEISYDGRTFERVGELAQGSIRLSSPDRPVRAVRITSTSDGNGSSSVIFQPLQIKP